MKPDIFLVTNSSLLGPIYWYDTAYYTSYQGLVGNELFNNWQVPTGYNIKPSIFEVEMAGSNVTDWSPGGDAYTNLLSPTNAKMFIISSLIQADIIFNPGTDFDVLIEAQLDFIKDILIIEKGATVPID